jgi:Helix-turn-helix domain
MSLSVIRNVLDHSPSSGTEKLVLVALAEWSDDRGVSCPRIVDIARRINRGRRCVTRAISLLVESGELFVEFGLGRGNPSSYQIRLRPVSRFSAWMGRQS